MMIKEKKEQIMESNKKLEYLIGKPPKKEFEKYLNYLIGKVFGKSVHHVKKTIIKSEDQTNFYFQADILYQYIDNINSVITKFSNFFPNFNKVENDSDLNTQCAIYLAQNLQMSLQEQYIANFKIIAVWDKVPQIVSLQFMVDKKEYSFRGINIQFKTEPSMNISKIQNWCKTVGISRCYPLFSHPSHYFRPNIIEPTKLIYPILRTIGIYNEKWRNEYFQRADIRVIGQFFPPNSFVNDHYITFEQTRDKHIFMIGDDFTRFQHINEMIAFMMGQYFGSFHPAANYTFESWIKKDGFWVMLTIPRTTLQLFGMHCNHILPIFSKINSKIKKIK